MGKLYSKQLAQAIAVGEFDVTAFKDELANAPDNHQVGSRLWFENSQVRVWEVKLGPGERSPFHSHADNYFWVCVDPGRAVQRYADGTIRTFDFTLGEVDFLELSEPAIHDLENVGDADIRFVAVEFKGDRGALHPH